jgi:TPR repeat protein
MYHDGRGVKQDYGEALRWFRKSADQGTQWGQLGLGVMYQYGTGVRQNYVQAVSWYRKAAEQGNADAQKALVVLYRQGVKGVPKDESQAVYWETKIFDQFRQHAIAWHAMSPRPPLPEGAARERILAENAVQEKNFESAVQHYRSGLSAFDTWPEGWFNLALISGELKHYADAADGMKHYLELVPDAPDAKDARTQMIIWEDKAKH